jgi:WD40 repeat protein
MTTVVQAAIDEQNPWPGLGSFDEGSERFFHGRQNESAELRRLVLNAPLTLLFGASGLGKTSLIQAGLFPLIRKGHYLPVYVRLDLSDRATPLIEQVKLALRTQLQVRCIDAPAMNDAEPLWCYLHRAGLELWSEQNQLLTPVFVFDQFEEVFTLGAENPASIARLRIDLADLIENRLPAKLSGNIEGGEALSLDSQHYKVLLSFREDFLPAVEGWKHDLPSILRNRLRLLPMSTKRAFEAVHETAPHLVDEEVAGKIVDFVAAAQGEGAGKAIETPDSVTELAVEPALLSLLCSGLNEKRKAQGKSTIDVDLLVGSGQSIISDYYAKSVGDLSLQVQRFIENELITERGFRKPCDIDDARSVHGVAERELRILVDRRVLRIEPLRGTERVELTHDLLTAVVRQHRDRERELAKVRRQRRRMAVFGAVGIFLLALAVTFASEWKKAEDALRIAHSERLATAALSHTETQLDLASLLSIEGFKFAPTYEARSSLFLTFQSKPELRTYLHHLSGVHSAAFSPDGRTLASASADHTVQLWDVASRQPLGEPIKGHADAVNYVAFSPDGKTLASGSSDKTVRLWDVASHKQIGEPLTGHTDVVDSVAFSPDGKTLVSASYDHTVRLWDVASRQQIGEALTGHSQPVNSAAFSPNGRTLASASADHTVRLWDVANHKQIGDPLTGHMDEVFTVAFSPDGKTLASGSSDKTVRLWDLASHKQIAESLTGHTDVVDTLAFSPDGKMLASGSGDKTVRIWDVASQKQIGEALTSHTETVWGVAFSPDGKTLASASRDKTVRLWDVAGRKQSEESLTNPGDFAYSVAFSPDGKVLASVSRDKTVRLWDVASHKQIGEPLTGHTEPANSVAFSLDGKMLASAGFDKTVRLWDVASHRQIGEALTGHTEVVNSVAFSPDGKTLASTGRDKTVRLWDVSSHKQIGVPFTGHTDEVFTVAFSPSGKTLASAGYDQTVRLWDVANHKQRGEPLTGHTDVVNSLAFSPDDKTLASGSKDKTVRLWDVSSHKQIGVPLTGHTEEVFTVAFSPDGKTLASGGTDQTVRLWDVAARQPLGEALTSHTEAVKRVAFNADGKALASASRDMRVLLWNVDPISWISRGCERANRNLSQAEWRQYMGASLPYSPICPNLPDGEGVLTNLQTQK